MTTLIAQIEEKMKALNPERLNFFILWLEDHTRLAGLAEKTMKQASLTDWLGNLSTDSVQQESTLIIAEILWCAETPLPEFRRIASSEARRFLDD